MRKRFSTPFVSTLMVTRLSLNDTSVISANTLISTSGKSSISSAITSPSCPITRSRVFTPSKTMKPFFV